MPCSNHDKNMTKKKKNKLKITMLMSVKNTMTHHESTDYYKTALGHESKVKIAMDFDHKRMVFVAAF